MSADLIRTELGGGTHYILEQIWVIYCDFEFFLSEGWSVLCDIRLGGGLHTRLSL